jgi:hypothetical protein
VEVFRRMHMTAFWTVVGRSAVFHLGLLLLIDVSIALAFYVNILPQNLPPRLHLSASRSELSESQFQVLSTGSLIIIAAISSSIRIAYPLSTVLHPYDTLIRQIPQYALAYIAGTHYPSLAPHLLRFSSGGPWSTLALSYSFCIFSALLISDVFAYLLPEGFPHVFLFELWNVAVAYLLSVAWLGLVYHLSTDSSSGEGVRREGERRRVVFERCHGLWKSFMKARYSYGAFLVHPAVLVALCLAVDMSPGQLGWVHAVVGESVTRVGKTVLLGTVSVVLSWLISRWLVENAVLIGSVI